MTYRLTTETALGTITVHRGTDLDRAKALRANDPRVTILERRAGSSWEKAQDTVWWDEPAYRVIHIAEGGHTLCGLTPPSEARTGPPVSTGDGWRPLQRCMRCVREAENA